MSTPMLRTPALFGWAGVDHAKCAYDLIGHEFPHFFIAAQTKASNQKRVVLWDAAKLVNGGQHLPTFTQTIGDCVSQGASNAVDYLSCVQIAQGAAQKYRQAFQPYIYGVARVQIGQGQISGDGALGIWAANGLKQYGALWADYEGVPQYSGQIARQWGASGPPQVFLKYAEQFKLGNAARVTNYTQVRDAISNLYPVTVASNRGFSMTTRTDRGKSWGVPQGTWGHQMCFIGVDDDPARPGVYVLNSWGASAFGTPADDAPPGGFWVDAEVVDSMTSMGDSWAYSQFSGFPEQELDFMLIGNDEVASADTSNMLLSPQKLELSSRFAPLYKGNKSVVKRDRRGRFKK